MKKFFKRASLALSVFLCNAFIASAEWSSADQELKEVQTQLKNSVETIVNICSIILGLIGVASLALAYAKHTKGDPSAADSLSKVGFGLVIVIILIQVIKMTLLR